MTIAADLIAELREARQVELALFTDLADDQMLGPQERFLEPPIWEVGHVGWFQEYWILRHLYGEQPILQNGDSIYDSFHVSYKRRWGHDFPSRVETLAYLRTVLDRCAHRLTGREPTPEEAYFYRHVTQHEYMHSENLAMVCQTLGYRLPALPAVDRGTVGFDAAYPRCDVEVPRASFPLGAPKDEPFVFDNEKWAHVVEIEPFRIANTPVTNAEFVEFVDGGGYLSRGCWGKHGWEWRRRQGAEHPRFWSKRDGRWCQGSFDQRVPLDPWHPVVHVNWHEAKAYCAWAGRRLPTEEWRRRQGAEHPRFWSKRDGRWCQGSFDQRVPLDPWHPVVHVNWHEAKAYCAWAGRRLPTAEWEYAASGPDKHRFPWGQTPPTSERTNLDYRHGGPVDVRAFSAGDSPFGCRQMIGNVWEWTDSYLEPYPGFVPDPYKEYSQPYFGQKPVLRGGAWTTRSGMIRNTWRNFLALLKFVWVTLPG